MSSLSSVPRRVALAEAVVLLLGAVIVHGVGAVDARALALAAGALWVLQLVVFGAAVAPRFRSLSASQIAAAPAEAAAAAVRFPATAFGALLLAGAGGAIAIAASVPLPADLRLALGGVGLGASLLGALLAYALCAAAVPGVLARLGAESAPRGASIRRKILLLCLGLDLSAMLLVVPAGYLRHREAVILGMIDAAGRLSATAASQEASHSAPQLAERLLLDVGSPAAVLDRAGRTLASAGGFPDEALPSSVPAPTAGETRISSGWVVTRSAPLHGSVAVFLADDAVLPQLLPFARSLLLAALVALFGTAVLAWLFADAITRPVGALGQAADRIAAGDLTASPASVSSDEMGLLAGQFRHMAQGLGALVREVQAASANVSSGAAEAGTIGEQVRLGALEQRAGVATVQRAVEGMAGSMGRVSAGMDALSEYVTSTHRTMEGTAESFDEVHKKGTELERAMGAALRDVEGLAAAGREAEARLTALENLAASTGGTLAEVKASTRRLELAAGETEETTSAVAQAAERARSVMEGTAQGIAELRRAVAEAHQRIAFLGQRSDDIDQVVEFISEVAGRTNLLSLNASIIAAQAGESGKVFAVVADQIRELAAQIARSTKSIGDILRAVRSDVEDTAALVDRGDALAAGGVELAQNSLAALEEIRASTTRGREAAGEIRAAIQRHAHTSNEVANLVERVAGSSQAVADAVQLVGRSVGGLHSVSRSASAIADRVARALEEQAGAGKRQRDDLPRLEAMLQDIARAVKDHQAGTQAVTTALEALSHTTGRHESAVEGLSGLSDQIGARARTLAERVNRFRV